MLPFLRRQTLVSSGTAASISQRLERNTAVRPSPAVPFVGRIADGSFRIRPVWTRHGATGRSAIIFPTCTLTGRIADAPSGARIDLRVRPSWPLPVGAAVWVAQYLIGLTQRSLGTEELGLVVPAAIFFGAWAYVVGAIARGSVEELSRLTLSRPEGADSDR